MAETTFNWLHFSDLHWGMPGQSDYWGVIEEQLLTYPQLTDTTWDLIFFTGDIIHGGLADNFTGLNGVLRKLEKVVNKNGIKPVLLAVPGNHELLAPPKGDAKKIADAWKKPPVLHEMRKLKKTEQWKMVENAFNPYVTWWNDPNRPFPKPAGVKDGLAPGDFMYVHEKDGYRFGVVGLNSTVLQFGSSADFKGKIEVRQAQLAELCGSSDYEWFEDKQLAFLLTHHPISWLSDGSRHEYNTMINRDGRFDFHLCGHLHVNEYEEQKKGIKSGTNKLIIGNSLYYKKNMQLRDGKHTGTHVERKHGFFAGTSFITDSSRTIRVWPKKVDDNLKFDKDTTLCEEGKEYWEYLNIVSPEDNSANDETIKAVVTRQIGEILQCESMICFLTSLGETQSQDITMLANRYARNLVTAGILEALTIVDASVNACIRMYDKQNKSISVQEWEKIEEIVGWVVTLAVRPEWISENSETEKSIFEISTKTKAGAEIAMARMLNNKATFTHSGSDAYLVVARSALCVGGLDTGIDPLDKYEYVLKSLYKSIFKREYPTDSEHDSVAKFLHETLRIRNEEDDRENHYVLLEINQQTDVDVETKVIEKLTNHLAGLPVVKFKATGSILIVEEEKLLARLNNIFNKRPN